MYKSVSSKIAADPPEILPNRVRPLRHVCEPGRLRSPVSRWAAASWPGVSSPEVTGTSASQTSSPARWSGRWRSAPGRLFAYVRAAGWTASTAKASLWRDPTECTVFEIHEIKRNIYFWLWQTCPLQHINLPAAMKWILYAKVHKQNTLRDINTVHLCCVILGPLMAFSLKFMRLNSCDKWILSTWKYKTTHFKHFQ